jgi:hypothetical protein
MPSTAERYARRATVLVFFVTGAVFATFASRIPAIQDRLDLSAGALSLAFLSLNAGAVAGLPAGAVLSARLGGRASLRLGYAFYPPALVAVALAPGLGALCAALAVMAAANSVIDVAMNVQGVEVERRYGRPVLSGFHAAHSFGVLGGGLAGLAAAAVGLSALAHFAITATLGTLWGLAATGGLLEDRGHGVATAARPSGRLALLGAVAFCAFLCEGGANDWSAVHLRSEHGAGEALAAAAFVAFSATLAIGRLVGDRAVAALGRARTVRAGGFVAAAGLAVALAAPHLVDGASAAIGSDVPAPVAAASGWAGDGVAPLVAAASGWAGDGVAPLAAASSWAGDGVAVVVLALFGWAAFGAGISLVAPTVIGAAPGVASTAAPVAIAGVTTIGYLGSFSGPPLIGALAELTSLSAALGLLVTAAGATALLAGPALGLGNDDHAARLHLRHDSVS